MKFKKEFPSLRLLKLPDNITGEPTNNYKEEDIQKHCIDKQRVKKSFDDLWNELDLSSHCTKDDKLIKKKITEQLKELGLEE